MSSPSVRVAIVTGAAQGIGRAIALRLARDGLNVIVNDLPSQQKQLEDLVTAIEATQQKAAIVVGDISCEADVQKLTDFAAAEFGGVDVMVANAGIALTSPITATSVEEWDRLHAINTRGTFLCYKAAAIQMIKQGRGGRIIGACSIAGMKGYLEWGAYCASKFAIKGLTQSAAAELKQHGITVNTYAPGLVDTPIWKDVTDHRSEKKLGTLPVPATQLLPSEDVAGVVSFLIRDEAKYVTGEALGINAGALLD